MKAKFIIPILICMSLLATSCQQRCVREGRSLYKKYFNHVLQDPSSLKIYSEKYSIQSGGVSVDWDIDYGAKNSFGAMVRDRIEFTTIGEKDMFFKKGGFFTNDDLD